MEAPVCGGGSSHFAIAGEFNPSVAPASEAVFNKSRRENLESLMIFPFCSDFKKVKKLFGQLAPLGAARL